MTTIWTLAADGSHARIFQAHGMERDMEEIQDFVNPLGRAKDSELRDDAQGRFAGKGEPMHSMATRVDQAEKEREEFARMLTQYLEQARNGAALRQAAPRRLAEIPRHAARAPWQGSAKGGVRGNQRGYVQAGRERSAEPSRQPRSLAGALAACQAAP
ncbi:host attachment protein [Cupriavidus oxalaticus]|uniref:host attachment protein n=1 Tax=Cupriavidus oxalaticus TaxID=96344 RepID=UPI003D64E952